MRCAGGSISCTTILDAVNAPIFAQRAVSVQFCRLGCCSGEVPRIPNNLARAGENARGLRQQSAPIVRRAGSMIYRVGGGFPRTVSNLSSRRVPK